MEKDTSPSLVILSGIARSGTSWLGKIFDSHPQTLYRHEPDGIQPWPAFPFYLSTNYEQYADALQSFVRTLPSWRTAKVSASLPVFAKAYTRPGTHHIISGTLRLVKALTAAGLEVSVPRYCLPRKDQALTVVWKTIASSGRLGFFAEVLRDKRIIHILRHPGAVVASQLRGIRANKFEQNFKIYEAYGSFMHLLQSPAGQRSGYSLDDLKAMTPLERLTHCVLLDMENAVDDLRGRPDCRLVMYEELCVKRFEIVEDLFTFCGLGFDAQARAFLVASGATHRTRYYSVFKDPLEAPYAWRKEMSPDEQQTVCTLLERSPLAHVLSD